MRAYRARSSRSSGQLETDLCKVFHLRNDIKLFAVDPLPVHQSLEFMLSIIEFVKNQKRSLLHERPEMNQGQHRGTIKVCVNMDDEPIIAGKGPGKPRHRILKPASHETNSRIVQDRNHSPDVKVSLCLPGTPVFRKSFKGVESEKPASGMPIQIQPLPHRLAFENAEFQVIDGLAPDTHLVRDPIQFRATLDRPAGI